MGCWGAAPEGVRPSEDPRSKVATSASVSLRNTCRRAGVNTPFAKTELLTRYTRFRAWLTRILTTGPRLAGRGVATLPISTPTVVVDPLLIRKYTLPLLG